MNWKIEEHSSIDKIFVISGPLKLEIDYDDVDQEEVDFLAKEVEGVLRNFWKLSGAAERYEEFKKQRWDRMAEWKNDAF